MDGPASTVQPSSSAGTGSLTSTSSSQLSNKLISQAIGPFIRAPDVEKGLPIQQYIAVHDRAAAVDPYKSLPPHRYRIAIIPQGKKPHLTRVAKDFFWFAANGLTTLETVYRRYAVYCLSDDFELLQGSTRVHRHQSLQELDVLDSKLIVLRQVGKDELSTPEKQCLSRPHMVHSMLYLLHDKDTDKNRKSAEVIEEDSEMGESG